MIKKYFEQLFLTIVISSILFTGVGLAQYHSNGYHHDGMWGMGGGFFGGFWTILWIIYFSFNCCNIQFNIYSKGINPHYKKRKNRA